MNCRLFGCLLRSHSVSPLPPQPDSPPSASLHSRRPPLSHRRSSPLRPAVPAGSAVSRPRSPECGWQRRPRAAWALLSVEGTLGEAFRGLCAWLLLISDRSSLWHLIDKLNHRNELGETHRAWRCGWFQASVGSCPLWVRGCCASLQTREGPNVPSRRPGRGRAGSRPSGAQVPAVLGSEGLRFPSCCAGAVAIEQGCLQGETRIAPCGTVCLEG